MVSTRRGIGSGNLQPKTQVIEHAPEVTAAPVPITMAGVQERIHSMMAEQKEEMRQILHDNRDEPIVPIVQPELNIE